MLSRALQQIDNLSVDFSVPITLLFGPTVVVRQAFEQVGLRPKKNSDIQWSCRQKKTAALSSYTDGEAAQHASQTSR